MAETLRDPGPHGIRTSTEPGCGFSAVSKNGKALLMQDFPVAGL
jgi:hypothetical protein